MKSYEVVLCFRFNWLPFLAGVVTGYAARWLWTTYWIRNAYGGW